MVKPGSGPCHRLEKNLETILKMSFGPISALDARFWHGVPVFKPSGATVSAILKILENLPRQALASLAPPV